MNPKMIGGISRRAFLLLAFGFCFGASTAFAAYQTITNDVWWKDNNGNPIMAQGGGISKFGSTYYWYGIQYKEMGPYYTNGTVNTSSSTFSAINCYSSTDLVHWTFQNKCITTSTAGFSNPGWVGRMGQCVYNSADNQYVMWFEGPGGQCCCTCSTPTGSFVLNNAQATITNVYYGPRAGDCTIFCDVDHGGTPYFICSDPHGRQHAYVCPLSSNYLTIGDATLIDDTDGISAWAQGQEANNMFERNGIYYYLMSNLAGWSYSSAYAVWSANIFTPTDYTADAAYQGTTADDTHYSQVSFGFQIAGTVATNYIMVGDRWSQFDGTYASAGFGTNFSIMCPITFTNGTPYFNSLHMFQIDTVTGNWRPATPANAPTNLTATSGNAQAGLNWAASDGATAYNLKRSTTSGGPYITIASPTTNNYTDTSVSNGTTYFYVVSSTNIFGESTNSAQVSVVPSTGPLINTASVNPNPVYPGQLVTISATVSVQASPIGTVTVDVSAIGELTNQVLVSDGAGDYTNTVTVGPTTPVAVLTLTVNASDNQGNISSPYSLSLTIGTVNDIWDGGGSDNNWSDGTNWAGGVVPGYGYSLIFSGVTRPTPMMDNSFDIYAVTFDSAASSFIVDANGGVLTLTGGVTNNSPNSQTLNVPVVLGAPVTVNAAAADVTLAQNITNGGNLLTITDGGHSTVLAGVISGAGGLNKSGTGTNSLYGNNTFTGGIIISNGTLTVGGTGQLGGGYYSGTIDDNGTLTFNSAAAQILSGIISGAGALDETGSAPLTLSGANTFGGPTTVTAGTLTLSNSLALQDSTLDYNGGNVTFSGITAAVLGGLNGTQNLSLINGGSTAVALTVGGNNSSTTYSGILSGSGASLTKAGTGTLILTGNNSYTGASQVNAGVLQLNPDGVINGGAANVAAVGGAQLVVSGGSLTSSASGNVGSGSSGLLVTSGSAAFNGGLTTDLGSDNVNLIEVSGGSLTAASLALGRTGLSDTTQPTAGSTADGLYVNGGTVNITGNMNMGTSSSANSSVSARIDGGSLTVGGALTIGLNNSGRWSVLDVNGGTLTVNDTNTGIAVGGPYAGDAELLVRAGTATTGKIGLGQGTTVETAVVDLTGGTLYVGSGGIVQVSTGAGFVSTITLGGGILGAGTNWSCSVPMTLASTTIQAADALGVAHNISLGGVLSGTGGLTKTGGGTLTLNGTNTYTGTTAVSGGILLVNTPNSSGTGTNTVTVASGATLGGTRKISGKVTWQSGALASFTNGSPLTVSNIVNLNNNTVTVNISGGTPLSAGSYTLMTYTASGSTGSFNVTPTITGAGLAAADTATVTTSGGTVSLIVNKSTPVLETAPTASAITYGQTLSTSTLSGGVVTNMAGTAVPGTFAFTAPTTTPGAGTASQPVTFTPTDTTDYNTVNFNVSVTINPQTPSLQAAPTATAIIYGQTFSSSTLSGGVVTNAAGTTVPGTFAFVAPSVTPVAGPTNVAVIFSPTDTADYNPFTLNVSVLVNTEPVTPLITLNSKTYDGTTAAATIATGSLTGVIGTDDVNLGSSGVVGAFTNKNAGISTVTITGLSLSGTTAGNYTLTSTSTTATGVITLANSVTTVTSSNNPAAYEGDVTFSATVSGVDTPTGSVQFQTNGVLFDTETLAGGVATSVDTTNLPPGTNNITAAYSGDENYVGSTNSLEQVETVAQFRALNLGGAGLVLGGSGGLPGGIYYVLVSTNMSAPLADWTPVLTNQFDDNGDFNFTNNLNTNLLQGFYIIQVQ